ncbi:MAG: hypothetical protein CVU87_00480 [Firmicutes bacterium HGW-Firmicutes-12]|nr:MAG: hypothetical protein CVU87_00480 [Firmicutes bacterium HGW-Firmicutes-12]
MESEAKYTYNLDNIFKLASQCNVHYVLAGTLYLRGTTRKHFFDFIEKVFPDEKEGIHRIYNTGGADKD